MDVLWKSIHAQTDFSLPLSLPSSLPSFLSPSLSPSLFQEYKVEKIIWKEILLLNFIIFNKTVF